MYQTHRRHIRCVRLSCLAGAGCACVLICAVLLAGLMRADLRYVGAFRPIEELWDMEDARQESPVPLLTRLALGESLLGYDRESNTFYCTLGMETEDSWPDLPLQILADQGVSACFADDYTYDSCREAIRQGTAYQLFTWTDTAFSYAQIVFTGLPQVCLHVNQPISSEDTPGEVRYSDGNAGLHSDTLLHLRGSATRFAEKSAYTLKFTKDASSLKKIYLDIPGFGLERKLILLPMIYDRLLMREKLSWDIWSELLPEDSLWGSRKTQYVEVFANDSYRGVYLLAEPYDLKAEFTAHEPEEFASIYRTISMVSHGEGERPNLLVPDWPERGIELRYSSEDGDFTGLETWIDLIREPDDAVFAQKAAQHVDIDSMCRYLLYTQACGLADNFSNNMYICSSAPAPHSYYSFYPWDLDISWGLRTNRVGQAYDHWLYFQVADRILNLDVAGARQRLADHWREMRQSVMTEAHVLELVEGYEALLTDSGAALRNAERWNVGDADLDGTALTEFAFDRFLWLDGMVSRIAGTKEPLPFLSRSVIGEEAGTSD